MVRSATQRLLFVGVLPWTAIGICRAHQYAQASAPPARGATGRSAHHTHRSVARRPAGGCRGFPALAQHSNSADALAPLSRPAAPGLTQTRATAWLRASNDRGVAQRNRGDGTRLVPVLWWFGRCLAALTSRRQRGRMLGRPDGRGDRQALYRDQDNWSFGARRWTREKV